MVEVAWNGEFKQMNQAKQNVKERCRKQALKHRHSEWVGGIVFIIWITIWTIRCILIMPIGGFDNKNQITGHKKKTVDIQIQQSEYQTVKGKKKSQRKEGISLRQMPRLVVSEWWSDSSSFIHHHGENHTHFQFIHQKFGTHRKQNIIMTTNKTKETHWKKK